MPIEAILSELRNRKNTLFLSFREIGSFYVDGYMHIYSAIAGKRGNKRAVRMLEDKLRRIDELKGFKISDNTSLGFDKKIAAFEIVQIEAPLYFGNDKDYTIHLIRKGKLEKGKIAVSPLPEEFYRQHYKRQAEFQIGPVAAVYELDEQLAELLKHQTRLNEKYGEFAKRVRHKHKLGEAIACFDGINFECVKDSVSKKDYENNSEKIKTFCIEFAALKDKLSKFGDGHVEYDKNHACFDVHLDFDVTQSKIPTGERKWIRFKRMRNLEEILSDNMTVFDIEKFEFDSDEERVDLVVMFNMKNGEIKNRIVLTRYLVNKEEINGYKVVYCKDADELVKKASDFIRGKFISREESYILSAYNIPYDAIEMRQEGNFSVGARESDPKKESTTKFFERIGVYGKHIIDPWDIAKIKFMHLPNQKLNMVSREVKAGSKREVNYRNARELSIAARTGRIEHMQYDTIDMVKKFLKNDSIDLSSVPNIKEVCAEILIDYATIDGDIAGTIQNTIDFRDALEDRIFLSNVFRIDPFKLIHDANRINDAQMREYWRFVGVDRDDVYKRWNVMIKYEERAMNRFRRFNFSAMKKPNKRGFFNNVYKVYVPLARFLRQQVGKNFPYINEIFEYTDRFSENKRRQADLAHYEDALCKLMIQDYAICMMEKDKYLMLINRIKKEAKIVDVNFDESLEKIFYIVRDQLSETKSGKEKYRNYNVSQRELKECLSAVNPNLIKIKGISIAQFSSLFNQWARVQAKERKVYGNYGVRAFFYPFAPEKIPSIEEMLNWREIAVMKFIDENNLELLHVQGDYIYLRGNEDAFFKKNCPFFVVDKIDRMMITANPSDAKSRDKKNELEQKIYYEKNGYFEGIQIEEEPGFDLTVFEMKTYGDFVKNMLAGNYEDALINMYDALDCLDSGRIPKNELVWFSKERKRYKAFEGGQRIYFYTDKRMAEGMEIRKDISINREYIIERIGKKKIDGKWEDNLQNVYLMQIDDFEPDWEMYKERIHKRSRDLLEPFLGKEFEKFLRLEINENDIEIMSERIRQKESRLFDF